MAKSGESAVTGIEGMVGKRVAVQLQPQPGKTAQLLEYEDLKLLGHDDSGITIQFTSRSLKTRFYPMSAVEYVALAEKAEKAE